MYRSQWIAKRQMRLGLDETNGYWKILSKDNPKYASRDDLTKIRSLVMHKKIAPKLLNYSTDLNQNPFHSKVTVHIHDDEDTKETHKYEILHWNGSSPLQCSSFKITKCSTGKTNYYQYFEAYLPHIHWVWYDNDSSTYQPYDLGIDVTEQMECSLQANLFYNYPENIHSDEKQFSEYFNCCSLNKMKKAMEEKRGNEDKEYLFRATYNEKTRRIEGLEQLSVSNFSFPRTIRRINLNKYENDKGQHDYQNDDVEDYCEGVDMHFNLRMQPPI